VELLLDLAPSARTVDMDAPPTPHAIAALVAMGHAEIRRTTRAPMVPYSC